MNNSFEDIINQACDQLRQGKTPAEIVSQWPQYQDQLAPLLATIGLFYSLPKKAVPQPAMQRKYILAPAKHLWLHWIKISRWAAVSTSALLLTAIAVTTGYAAYASRPGDIMFGFKKAAEHAQVQFTLNQQQKINLQLAIAEQRLSDAQAALNQPNNPQKQTAALNELAAETQNTLDAITQTSQSNVSQDHPLIASLQSITSKQQALLQTITTNQPATIDQSVLNAAKQNATKVATIQQFLKAANSDQALTALNSNPSAITATGTISQLTYNTVTINNNQLFTLTRETIVKNPLGLTIAPQDLQLKQSVEILGDQADTGLTAREITVVDPSRPFQTETDRSGEVKGAATTTPASATTTKASDKLTPTTTPASGSNEPQAIAPDPNAAIGTYIIEDPAPLCANNNCGN